jgi:hypothetical protein
MVWGNGGCAINSTRYGGFLTTIASHGFLVMATAAEPGATGGRATADNLRKAVNWAEAENKRAGSPLNGKIAVEATFDATETLPAFYGARHGAGHTATVDHPGGGEWANVASNWLRWQLKGDKQAAKMFVGKDCSLCTDPNWDTASKRLQQRRAPER